MSTNRETGVRKETCQGHKASRKEAGIRSPHVTFKFVQWTESQALNPSASFATDLPATLGMSHTMNLYVPSLQQRA